MKGKNKIKRTDPDDEGGDAAEEGHFLLGEAGDEGGDGDDGVAQVLAGVGVGRSRFQCRASEGS